MKAAVLLSAAVGALGFPRWHQLKEYTFEQYLEHSGKEYAASEVAFRRAVFAERLAKIQAHNAKGKSWKAGVNKFTDMTDEERKRYLGHDAKTARVRRHFGLSKGRKAHQEQYASVKGFPSELGTPTNVRNFSWIDYGYMGSVKDQGGCGSCWAFSSTSVLESRIAISGKNRGVPTLSPQQFVDCVKNEKQCGGSGGCNGATAELAYAYAGEMGIHGEYEYPYMDINGQGTNASRCPTRSRNGQVKVKGYVELPTNDQDALLRALLSGPVVLSVFAGTWFDYESGVYSGCEMTENVDIDHAVTLTGVGSDENGAWMEIRNSWGPVWGEHGVIRLRMATTPACFVDTTPLDGYACKLPGPPPANITVCGECGVLADSVYPVDPYYVGQ